MSSAVVALCPEDTFWFMGSHCAHGPIARSVEHLADWWPAGPRARASSNQHRTRASTSESLSILADSRQ